MGRMGRMGVGGSILHNKISFISYAHGSGERGCVQNCPIGVSHLFRFRQESKQQTINLTHCD